MNTARNAATVGVGSEGTETVPFARTEALEP